MGQGWGRKKNGRSACLAFLKGCANVEKHPTIFLWRKPVIYQFQNLSLEPTELSSS